MNPADWPQKWARYVFYNEKCRYEHDRRTKGAFYTAVPWNEGVLLNVYRHAHSACRVGRVA